MAAACEPEVPLTCEQKEDLELLNAQREFDRLCAGDASMHEILLAFIFPKWATDAEDQRKALINYITRHAICLPSNNVGVDCEEEEPCEDPQPTYCPDPLECPSKFYGYGLLEVIKSAIRADSMVRLPVKDLDLIANGEPLVWDATVAPDNTDCDPCTANVLGAFIPQHVYEELHP